MRNIADTFKFSKFRFKPKYYRSYDFRLIITDKPSDFTTSTNIKNLKLLPEIYLNTEVVNFLSYSPFNMDPHRLTR